MIAGEADTRTAEVEKEEVEREEKEEGGCAGGPLLFRITEGFLSMGPIESHLHPPGARLF